MENRLVFTYILQFPLFFFIDKQNITDNSFESFSTEYLVNEETLEDSFQNRDYDKVWLDRMGKKILSVEWKEGSIFSDNYPGSGLWCDL